MSYVPGSPVLSTTMPPTKRDRFCANAAIDCPPTLRRPGPNIAPHVGRSPGAGGGTGPRPRPFGPLGVQSAVEGVILSPSFPSFLASTSAYMFCSRFSMCVTTLNLSLSSDFIFSIGGPSFPGAVPVPMMS